MDEATKRNLIIGAAILAVVAAIGFLFWFSARPSETVNDLSKIPPKGAGKFDKDTGDETRRDGRGR